MPITRHPRQRATFIPFGRMTPRQQAEHLVQAHGMNGDYFGDEAAAGKSDEEVIQYLLGWPAGMTDTHTDDHDYVDAEPDVLACQHTHTKGLPEFRCPMGDWTGNDGFCPRHRCRSGRYDGEV